MSIQLFYKWEKVRKKKAQEIPMYLAIPAHECVLHHIISKRVDTCLVDIYDGSMSQQPELQRVNPQQFQPQVPKKSKGLLYLEFGLFEVFFVLAVLFLLFASLNFFNILSLSKIIPSFSFLPRLSNNRFTTPNSLSSSQGSDQYKSILIAFIQKSLNSSSLPFNLTQPSFVISHFGNIYSASWTNVNVFVEASLTVSPIKKTPVSFHIEIGPLQYASISSSLAESTTKKYATTPLQSNYSCNSLNAISYCETFLSSPEEKVGYGLTQDVKNQIYFFYCKIPTANANFMRQKSCIP